MSSMSASELLYGETRDVKSRGLGLEASREAKKPGLGLVGLGLGLMGSGLGLVGPGPGLVKYGLEASQRPGG